MNLSSSFQLLRTCAAASSSRAAARPALRGLPARVSQPRRHYSDKAAGEQPKDEAKPQESSEKNEVAEKLKAKEEEVTDLKVCLARLLIPVIVV